MPDPCHATTDTDLDAARRLFRAYVDGLGFDLDFRGFEAEMRALPGSYARPDGGILLADAEGAPVGVVAVRPLDEEGVCETKRLYVRPEHRGQGLGRSLASAVIEEARALGHDTMRLDTVTSMTAARCLYRSLGFQERDAYYHNPPPDAVYMERGL
jgi:GNAT superfamily N-acetyltransferase